MLGEWDIYAVCGLLSIDLCLFLYISYLHGRIQKQSEMIGHIIAVTSRLEQEIHRK